VLAPRWPEALLPVYNAGDDPPRRPLVKLRSLGLRSDLALLHAEILDRGGYLVVRSPLEPSFYWGNLLVFPGPPKAGDRERWEALFAREFGEFPKVLHKTFTWDLAEEPGDTSAFTEAGYQQELSVVLTAAKLCPPKFPNAAIEIRRLHGAQDWLEVEEMQVACRGEEHEEEHFRGFVQARLRDYRKRIDAGQGEWYGAFLAQRMVASLGIFREGAAARFQVVMTYAEFRRQGVCATLVHHVASEALARPEIDTLIMVADTEYHAARIYESLGFAPAEKLTGLCLWPS
jgi:GNAT superfamily N-acetyltransferase